MIRFSRSYWLTLGALALSAPGVLAGCGERNPERPPAQERAEGPPVGNAGVYLLDYGQFTGIYTLLEDGTFSGVHFVNDGNTVAGHPHGKLSPANSIDALEPIGWANFIDYPEEFGAQEANARFGRTFTENALEVRISRSTFAVEAGANRQLTYSKTDLRPLYGTPLTLDEIAGGYTGLLCTVGVHSPQLLVDDFEIGEDAGVRSTVGDCEFTGTLRPRGSTGIFDIEMSTAGANCGFTNPLSGIVTPFGIVDGRGELAFQLDNSTQTAVFTVTKR